MTTAPAQCSLSIVAIRRVWQGRPSWRGLEEELLATLGASAD
jgi:hypothetical protein